jgi:hypothetical protein
MAAQTLTLAGKRYVLLPEREYRRLSDAEAGRAAEDRRDATILRARLAEMRQRKEEPVPFAKVRRELGLA